MSSAQPSNSMPVDQARLIFMVTLNQEVAKAVKEERGIPQNILGVIRGWKAQMGAENFSQRHPLLSRLIDLQGDQPQSTRITKEQWASVISYATGMANSNNK